MSDDRPLPANAYHKYLEATGQKEREEAEMEGWLESQGMRNVQVRMGEHPAPADRPYDFVLVGRLGPKTFGFMLEVGSVLNICSICGEIVVVSKKGLEMHAAGIRLVCRECVPRLVKQA